MGEKTYLLLQPLNFAAFSDDTGDLSTLRGGSLTMLRAPGLLLDWLKTRTQELGCDLDILQNAASELFVALSFATDAANTAVDFTAPSDLPEGDWRKDLNAVRKSGPVKKALRDNAMTAEILEKAVRQRLRKPHHTDAHRATMVAQVMADYAPAHRPLTPDETRDLLHGARAFLSAEQGGYPLDLMSFGLDAVAVADTLSVTEARGTVEARIRRAQLQTWTVPLPEPGAATDAQNAVCHLTNTLPASPGEKKKERLISLSVARRRKVGRRAKTDFYQAELQRAKVLFSEVSQNADLAQGENGAASENMDRLIVESIGDFSMIDRTLSLLDDGLLKNGFVNDFQELVATPPDNLPVSLRKGICVVYADGNKFGEARKAAIQKFGHAGLRGFSTWLELRKAVLLADILEWIAACPAERVIAGKAAFETLFWGGDEFAFVMPAWCGWDFACLMARRMSAWKAPFHTKALSFGIGVSYGKAKTPIRRLRASAGACADLSKDASREETLFHVVAYESVDTVALRPDAFYEQRFGKGLDMSRLVLSAESVLGAKQGLEELSDTVGFSGLMAWLVETRPHFAAFDRNVSAKATSDGAAGAVSSALRAHLGRVAQKDGPANVVFAPRVNDDASKMTSLALGLLLKDYIRSAEAGAA